MVYSTAKSFEVCRSRVVWSGTPSPHQRGGDRRGEGHLGGLFGTAGSLLEPLVLGDEFGLEEGQAARGDEVRGPGRQVGAGWDISTSSARRVVFEEGTAHRLRGIPVGKRAGLEGLTKRSAGVQAWHSLYSTRESTLGRGGQLWQTK